MKRIRIGNGCGFWGDNLDAPIHLAHDGRLDYLTLEYLAELTMSILAVQKAKNPAAGFATDFLDVLGRLVPILKDQPRLKIITNAGGMNPHGCAAKARDILAKAGLADRRIGVVSGDDLMPRLDAVATHLNHLDSGEPLATIRDRVVSANAYLGAQPIAEALAAGASIVITGRVADASLTVGPVVHEFGWNFGDLDKLASATVAGHLIECGAQATGGLWINADYDTKLAQVGYPIAEIADDGSFTITKPPGSGGAVNVETVSEQLLYEVADPARYSDARCDCRFHQREVEQAEQDVVAVSPGAANGNTESYKVSIAYRDGYMAAGTLLIAGPECRGQGAAIGGNHSGETPPGGGVVRRQQHRSAWGRRLRAGRHQANWRTGRGGAAGRRPRFEPFPRRALHEGVRPARHLGYAGNDGLHDGPPAGPRGVRLLAGPDSQGGSDEPGRGAVIAANSRLVPFLPP